MDDETPFATLIPHNKSPKVFDGFLTIGGDDYRICIAGDSLNASSLYLDWRLQFLNEVSTKLKERLDRCGGDLKTFLAELHTLLEKKNECRTSSVPFCVDRYTRLFTEMEELGWDQITSIDNDLTQISLHTIDAANRKHILHLTFTMTSDVPDVRHDLPLPFALSSQSLSLKAIQQEFSKEVERFQQFWNLMEDVDKNAWILEPENPSKKDTSRRIVLKRGISLQMTVNPLDPCAMPECLFLGSDEEVAKLRDEIGSNVNLWDMNDTILNNLRKIGLEFLKPDASAISFGLSF